MLTDNQVYGRSNTDFYLHRRKAAEVITAYCFYWESEHDFTFLINLCTEFDTLVNKLRFVPMLLKKTGATDKSE